MTPPSSRLRERVLAAAREEPSLTRAALAKRRGVALALALAWTVALAFSMRAHVPPASGLLLLVAWLGVAAVASYVSFSTKRWSWGAPRGVMRLLPIALSLIVIVAAIGIGVVWGHDTPREGHHVQCLAASAAMGVAPLGLALWVERGRDPIAPGASGAALGALTGAWSGVGMSFVCGRSEVGHTIFSHVAALLLLTVAAALLGRRWLALR